MNSNSIFLFFFLSLHLIYSSSSLNTTHKCSLQQSHALLLFKQNLSSINHTSYKYNRRCENWLGSGYYPIMTNWNTSTDCCDWNGVTCDHSTGDVVGLDLSCGMLQGTIHPNTTLFHLPRLQKLNLAWNDFTDSQLPPQIGRVSNSLTHLNISHCGFTGQVPKDISHLHKLVYLDLAWNWINLEPRVFVNLLQNSTVMKELLLNNVSIASVLPTNLNISSSCLKLLSLYNTGLQGNLPHSFFNLQSLEELDLRFNSFTGHIPSEISLLPKLVSLDLRYNGIGKLLIRPDIFSILITNSTFLRYLWLEEVNIGWVLPTYLNISSSLRELVLSFTSLRGKLPHNILNLKHLEIISLAGNNNLSGPFPKVNTSTSIPLWWLDLSDTRLSGEIPASIGHLNSLHVLGLSDCGLNGSLPNSLSNLRYLEMLSLSNNMLSGILPSSLFTLPFLRYITLENNMFQGNIPLELFSLQYLEILSVSNNQLTGQIDVLDNGLNLQTFQRLTSLYILDLSYNNIRGVWELDALFSSLKNLDTLILSHSGISVTTSNANHYVNPGLSVLSLASCSLQVLPVSLRAMKNLQHLDLSDNDIHGHIPDWVGEMGGNQLVVLDLSNNSITGTIPNVYEDWSELEGFILNTNQLEGKVPASLYNCRNLRIIDLGNNKLNDTFPDWLEDLPNLQTLVLRSNNFHAGIVTSSTLKFPFQSLRVLDLSHNEFEGQLPTKYFQNFNGMKNVVKHNTKPEYMLLGRGLGYYYSITIVMKGVDQYFPQLLVQYTIIDVSDNKFDGEIPNIIGNLNSLKALNLSHNSLTGRIPHALGKISEIESLDMSWNQLIGEIPQSLADLTFLEILNLSQNHLVGRFPRGKQFNTFDANSFGGNPNLCGLPLSKECSVHLQKPQPEDDGDEEENGFTWKVVMMGYGCGVLVGIILGYLMLSTGRPKWFNAIADATEHTILKKQKQRRYV